MIASSLSRAACVAIALFSSLANTIPAPLPQSNSSIVAPGSGNPATKFNWATEKVKGVNVGGWFLLEPWITPSLFDAAPDDVVDEYTMSQHYGKKKMAKLMQKHWSTFIKEDDFKQMKAAGLNMVRIPIGYWSVAPIKGDPYVQGAYKWFAKAIEWAQANNLMVLIDLHGAPGSQNGFDNSGRRGAIEWTQGETVPQTLAALEVLRKDYGQHPAVAAIELLNEPLSYNLDIGAIKSFYEQGLAAMQPSNTPVVFHDAFNVSMWNDFHPRRPNVAMDTHHYEIFLNELLQLDTQGHVQSICEFSQLMTQTQNPTFSGEMTGAMTDCTKYLNGRGYGARYDGTFHKDDQTSEFINSCEGKVTGSIDTLSQEDIDQLKTVINAQFVAYKQAAGWIWWTWHTESSPHWDFKALLNAGIIPQPLDSGDQSVCG